VLYASTSVDTFTYKAERAGIRVEKVDAYQTSQRCSACGRWEPVMVTTLVFEVIVDAMLT